MDKNECRIVFMGTPEFAAESLKILDENRYNISAVVTAPDKPAGRGLKILESDVKKYALENNLPVLQPEKLKNEDFVNQLKELNPHIIVVVAFRMLPEVVWRIPTLGTFNLHASLLPQYRGAAPINWAVINNEKETGITTFLIDANIDTGSILFQEKISIEYEDDAGVVHDKLMKIGAQLVLKTINALIKNDYSVINQNFLISDNTILKHAPKINKDDCRINWTKPISDIYNHIRGLSPYPTAFTEIYNKEKSILLKIYKAKEIKEFHNHKPETIYTDNKTFFKVAVNGGYINILNIQQAGKIRMNIADFLRGFNDLDKYRIKNNCLS